MADPSFLGVAGSFLGTALTAGSAGAVVSGLFQMRASKRAAEREHLMFQLAGEREQRTWSRSARLAVAVEFVAACGLLYDAGRTMESMRVALQDANRRLGEDQADGEAQTMKAIIEANHKRYIDSREGARMRSREALSSMRLGFPKLRQECEDLWSTCEQVYITGSRLAHPQVIEEKLSSLEASIDEMLRIA